MVVGGSGAVVGVAVVVVVEEVMSIRKEEEVRNTD